MRAQRRAARVGGLNCHVVDGFGAGMGPVVVLLHGFGAPGSDLVSLAHAIPVPPGSTFIFPEAPLELAWGADSRAWWMIDIERLERAAMTGRPVELPREPPAGLVSARELVMALLAEIPAAFGASADRLVLGGVSQGAMRAGDVAVRAVEAPAGLALFSPTILAPAEWPALMPRLKGRRVLISHGSEDPLLPFAVSERLQAMLRDAGANTSWVPFRGAHEIPAAALDGLARLLKDVATGT